MSQITIDDGSPNRRHPHHHQPSLGVALPSEVAASATSHTLPLPLLTRMMKVRDRQRMPAATVVPLTLTAQGEVGCVMLQALHCYTVAAFTGGVGGVSEAMDAELDLTGQLEWFRCWRWNWWLLVYA